MKKLFFRKVHKTYRAAAAGWIKREQHHIGRLSSHPTEKRRADYGWDDLGSLRISREQQTIASSLICSILPLSHTVQSPDMCNPSLHERRGTPSSHLSNRVSWKFSRNIGTYVDARSDMMKFSVKLVWCVQKKPAYLYVSSSGEMGKKPTVQVWSGISILKFLCYYELWMHFWRVHKSENLKQ